MSTRAGKGRRAIKLSIIIPAYNEEHRISPTLENYAGYFSEKYRDDFEIIVVVNGSRDRTPEIAQAFADRIPQVRAVIEPRAIGKGGAVMMGFDQAESEYIGFVDADGATPPEAFDELFQGFTHPNIGIVIASRWLPESRVGPQPPARRVASRIFNGLVRQLFRLRITDTQCGAKLLKRAAVVQVLPQIGLTRWAFDVDLLFKLRRAGYGIAEVPTEWNDVEGSKINVPRASLEMLLAIIRLRIMYSPFAGLVKLYDATLGRLIHRS